MPISRDEFADAYPILFHISLAQDVEQVMRHGLLSTSALLDRCEVNGEQRFNIESCQRPRSMPISHSVHGEFLINDQAPMNAAALSKCLIDLSPEQWCRSLNRRVFFWPTQGRLAKHIGAKLADGRPKIVFSFERMGWAAVGCKESVLVGSGSTRSRSACELPFSQGDPPASYWFRSRRQRLGDISEA